MIDPSTPTTLYVGTRNAGVYKSTNSGGNWGPANAAISTLRIAALLDKPSRRIERIDADYIGFSIPNLFVIGYGMDYAERYRNLPDICLMPGGHPE